MANKSENELDRILDSALTSYCDRAPWPGLEERVLRRVSASARLRRYVQIPLLLSAAASLVLIAVWWQQAPAPVPPLDRSAQETRSQIDKQRSPERALDVASVEVPKSASERRRRVRLRAEAPRAAQFPTPSALTTQERAVILLSASNPDLLVQAVVFQDRLRGPLVMNPILIAPLTIENVMED